MKQASLHLRQCLRASESMVPFLHSKLGLGQYLLFQHLDVLVLASSKDIEQASVGHTTPEAELVECWLDIPSIKTRLPRLR